MQHLSTQQMTRDSRFKSLLARRPDLAVAVLEGATFKALDSEAIELRDPLDNRSARDIVSKSLAKSRGYGDEMERHYPDDDDDDAPSDPSADLVGEIHRRATGDYHRSTAHEPDQRSHRESNDPSADLVDAINRKAGL